jgi:sulfatase maturation enzyme AslB (radical SAM superfamily)
MRNSDSPLDDLWIWLDVTALCNLKCRDCYTITLQRREFLDLPTCDAILTKIQHHAASIRKLHFNWRGEPTLNPDLGKLLALAAEKLPETEVEWHTNCVAVTSKMAAEIVSSHPRQKIMLSLDGGNRESYERNRGQGIWQKALSGARTLADSSRGIENVKVYVYQIDYGVPEAEWDLDFSDLLMKVDGHTLVKPIRSDGFELDEKLDYSRPCFWLGNALAISCAGDTFTCILATGTKTGNILTDDLDTIIMRSKELRAKVSTSGRHNVSGCSGCLKKPGSAETLR